MFKLSLNSYFVFLVALGLVSCAAEQNPAPTNGTPNNTSNPFAASSVLGTVQRNYYAQENVSCLVASSHGEAVITFNNPQSGSSLSIRLQKLGFGNYERWISPLNGGETILISLGGDSNQNLYQIGRNASTQNCYVRTQSTQDFIQGTFQCQNLTNRNGVTQPASGYFSCKIQSSEDWNW